MSYVDGFLIAVPENRKDDYLAQATKAAEIFKRCGAVRIVECWGDDIPDGKVTDFRRSVKAEPGESVVFSWVEWPDKEARNKGMAAFMAEATPGSMGEMPFDGQRMIFGGFAVIVDRK